MIRSSDNVIDLVNAGKKVVGKIMYGTKIV